MNSIRHILMRAGLVLGAVMAPAFAFAQEQTSSKTLNLESLSGVVNELLGFIDTTVVPVIFAIAFIVFIWGMFQYFIAGANNEEKLKAGKNLILWGLIAFVVMISIWGIVKIFTNTLGFDGETRPDLPKFNQSSGQ